jgi:hypothetical protein
MAQEMALWQPSTSLSTAQRRDKALAALKWSTSPHDASRLGKMLVSAWPHANPPDPKGYAASIASVLEQYPLGVVEECCDPRLGLARGREFPPTIAAVTTWCENRIAHYRFTIRQADAEDGRKREAEFTPEHCKSMRERLAALMNGLFNSADDTAQSAAE